MEFNFMAGSNLKLDYLRTPFLRDQVFHTSIQLNHLETLSKDFLYKFSFDTIVHNLTIMIWELICSLKDDLNRDPHTYT